MTGSPVAEPATPDPVSTPRRARLVPRLLAWLALYALGIAAYNQYHPLVKEWLVYRLQVIPSVQVIRWTLPGQPVTGNADSIRTTGLDLQILRGCDGIEAWLLLVTALCVFPMPRRRRALGVLAGTLLMLVLNVVRVVSLFHIALRRPDWMDVAHGYVWQSLIVLAAAVFVLAWTDPRHARPSTGGASL